MYRWQQKSLCSSRLVSAGGKEQGAITPEGALCGENEVVAMAVF